MFLCLHLFFFLVSRLISVAISRNSFLSASTLTNFMRV